MAPNIIQNTFQITHFDLIHSVLVTLSFLSINSQSAQSTTTPESISCHNVFDGDYIEPTLFELNLSTPQVVTFDGCNSTSEPNIQIYSSDNDTIIWNQCGFKFNITSNCCNVPFITNLPVGAYIFELQLNESSHGEQNIFEYIIDVTCDNFPTILTETTNENFIDNEPDDDVVAFWVWILITISGSCWIFVVIVLIKRKKNRMLTGMTIRSDDITLSDVNKTSRTYLGVNDDEWHDEQINEELQRFMDEDI
eukprot:292293_1